jgi:predicted cobalt transporter CbtA
VVGNLLLRGMLVGALAGLLCFAFLKTFGEPAVDRAIAFETQMDAAKEAKAKADAPAAAPAAESADKSMPGMAMSDKSMPGMAMPDDGQEELISRGV